VAGLSGFLAGLGMPRLAGADGAAAPVLPRDGERTARLTPLAKRAMDIAIAGAALLLAAPFFLLVSLLVRADGGPAFFAHARVGRGGRLFGCLKFRSMVVDSQARLDALLAADPAARAEWEETRKLRDDPRVTRIGRFLRATSLDELPQLINVLRGEMSLVGPRPLPCYEVELFQPWQHLRHEVPPGMTGFWQVYGRSVVAHEDMVLMDAYYVMNWSLAMDSAILFRTGLVLLAGKGAV
jgi:lipopolysaccharide/colanic/teichoic acid biosynthesis glycosyltransferase